MGLTFDDEYDALHRRAVWTDRGTRDARLAVRGPDAVDWLQGLLTQEVKRLAPGQGTYAAYLTPQGRMVADLRVFHRGDTLLLETPSSARDAEALVGTVARGPAAQACLRFQPGAHGLRRHGLHRPQAAMLVLPDAAFVRASWICRDRSVSEPPDP